MLLQIEGDGVSSFYGTARRRVNAGSNSIPFANNFQSIDWDGNGDNNGTGNYPPGTPITITIDGIPSAHNGLIAEIWLSTSGFDDLDAFESNTVAFSYAWITNGSITLTIYCVDDEEPFATAGDYFVALSIWSEPGYYHRLLYLYGTSMFINYGTNPIPFAGNFQPITLD